MANLSSPLGFLVPLKRDLSVDVSAEQLLIFPGENCFGRGNLAVQDRRVSRRHLILHASGGGRAEIVVEGANPVVIRSSGDQRTKLCCGSKSVIDDGDVLELIPGGHFFKYTSFGVDVHKRKRDLHEVDVPDKVSSKKLGKNSLLTIRNFKASNENLSTIFRLMRVKDLPSWANSSSVGLQDVIQGNIIFAILSNYMVDIDWLLSDCPLLGKIRQILIIHGESGASLEHMKKRKPSEWILHKPPLPISYGTHHSKAMLLVYPHGLRVIIHTANLIYVDWNNKTQGLWMQDFPLKDEHSSNKACPFEDDLVDYLKALKWAELSVNLPSIGQATIDPSFFRRFDYRSATVRLIASVPGYHSGPYLKKWGHMKLRSVLEKFIFDNYFKGSSLVYQFSSLGSLDEKWMSEFATSLSSGISNDGSPLGPGKVKIIWPTVEDVRCSLEGYAAGNAIPSPVKNVEKEFLKKYWVRWRAAHTGRCHAMPHIKSYTRYAGQNLAWFLLTSANLSKAAWGALQKNNSQIFIRSYELGVLFLPSRPKDSHSPSSFSCTDNGSLMEVSSLPKTVTNTCHTRLVTLGGLGEGEGDIPDDMITLPVPYELPPQPYTSEDVPWSWERRYSKKDIHGQVWPRQVQLYVDQDM